MCFQIFCLKEEHFVSSETLLLHHKARPLHTYNKDTLISSDLYSEEKILSSINQTASQLP